MQGGPAEELEEMHGTLLLLLLLLLLLPLLLLPVVTGRATGTGRRTHRLRCVLICPAGDLEWWTASN